MLEIMTVKQAAELLQVNKATIYRMIRTKRLKATQFGSHYRISKAAIDAYIAGGSLPAGDIVSSEQDEAAAAERLATQAEAKKRQIEVERITEQIKVAKLEIELQELTKVRQRPEQLDAREEELDTKEEEIGTRELALNTKELAMEEEEVARQEAYDAKVREVDARINTRIQAGIDKGINDERAAMAEERVATTKVLKVHKEMYNKGVYWANRFAYMVKAQGSYSDADKRAQEDAAVRSKAMMEAVGFSSVLGERFNFENKSTSGVE